MDTNEQAPAAEQRCDPVTGERDKDASSERSVHSAAEKLDTRGVGAEPVAGLSVSPGLRELPNSKVPGTDRSHVHGPQQAPCDPMAAGLDVDHHPLTRAENRAVTLTGADGSGPHLIPVDAPRTHETVPAPADEQPAIGEVPEVKKGD